MDPFEKPCCEVSRHPHAPVGRGIPRQKTGMHAYCLAEFHVVRHWRRLIVETMWYSSRCVAVAFAYDRFFEAELRESLKSVASKKYTVTLNGIVEFDMF